MTTHSLSRADDGFRHSHGNAAQILLFLTISASFHGYCHPRPLLQHAGGLDRFVKNKSDYCTSDMDAVKGNDCGFEIGRLRLKGVPKSNISAKFNHE